ncbi:MAG: tetratricopeptide repeat protein [Planctomycetota bacterium]
MPTARVHFERALSYLEQALDPQHPRLMTALSNLASIHGQLDDIDTAASLLERALAIPASGRDVDPGQHARVLQNFGNVCAYRGDLDGAQRAWEQSLAIWIELAGEQSLAAGSLYRSLAEIWEYRGDEAKAAELRARAATSSSR